MDGEKGERCGVVSEKREREERRVVGEGRAGFRKEEERRAEDMVMAKVMVGG